MQHCFFWGWGRLLFFFFHYYICEQAINSRGTVVSLMEIWEETGPWHEKRGGMMKGTKGGGDDRQLGRQTGRQL